jgi:hypothetical protein
VVDRRVVILIRGAAHAEPDCRRDLIGEFTERRNDPVGGQVGLDRRVAARDVYADADGTDLIPVRRHATDGHDVAHVPIGHQRDPLRVPRHVLELGQRLLVVFPEDPHASSVIRNRAWQDAVRRWVTLVPPLQTINRIVDVFPAHQQQQIRTQLSFTLQAVYCQQLLPKVSGRGRALALELMIANPAIRALIRDNKAHQIYSIIQTSGKLGMRTMNHSLYELYRTNVVAYDEALSVSTDPAEFTRQIRH